MVAPTLSASQNLSNCFRTESSASTLSTWVDMGLIGNARKGIGIIKHLSTYLPLKTRDQIFKMLVRSHLDYCDMIYHFPVKTREMNNFDCSRTPQYLMKLVESTQYQAFLAVSWVWKLTS